MILESYQNDPIWFWYLIALSVVAQFFIGAGLMFRCCRRRRWGLAGMDLAVILFSYFLLQIILSMFFRTEYAFSTAVAKLLLAQPRWVLVLTVLLLFAVQWLVWRRLRRYEAAHVTPMSVKEALDNLPAGICAWLPGGRIVLVNYVMEALCRTVTGDALCSGALFRRQLEESGLMTADGTLCLQDGSVRTVSTKDYPFDGGTLTVMMASDVTDVYQKTLALEQARQRLSVLNRRLAEYNREIVDLTSREEVLKARIRLHDQLGEDLLVVRRLMLQGGSDEEYEAVRSRLRRNIQFLKNDTQTDALDEVDLMLQTAERLGVRVEISGAVPQTEPLRHIVASGIHENFTNVLRHARGDTLRVELREEGDVLTAVFSGNGDPPGEEAQEKGGLGSLRDLTERAGGQMIVSWKPVLTVTLVLPKEVPHDL